MMRMSGLLTYVLFVGLLMIPCESFSSWGTKTRGNSRKVVRSVTGFSSTEDYNKHLEDIGTLPEGFSASTTTIDFVVEETGKAASMYLNLLLLDQPTDRYAITYTKNAFPGCPVKIGKKRIAEGRALQAIVINNKVANVAPRGDGVADGEKICAAVAEAFNLPQGSDSVLTSSTGVIGWRLPVNDMISAVPRLKDTGSSIVSVAKGIMTTDAYPKIRRFDFPKGSIVGVVKGAGMIEPNMATMLSFITTDIDIPLEELQGMLKRVVDKTYNCVTVDSDMSTSDTTLLISSCRVKGIDVREFEDALMEVCKELAIDIVRNGEGTQHVMQVTVRGAPSFSDARFVGKKVVNSPLFKTAISGNDPNVGRLLAAVGTAISELHKAVDTSRCSFKIGDEVVFKEGSFDMDEEREKVLSEYLRHSEMPIRQRYPSHFRKVKIDIDLGGDSGIAATVYGSDLTKEYVSINADYRS